MVALLLPLSSLWASMAINEETSRLDINHLSGANMQISNTSPSNRSNGFTRTAVTKHTEYTADDEKADYGHFSPTSVNNKIESGNSGSQQSGRDSTEQDLEAMGVRMDKSYRVESANQ